jgi:hypothetical protein
MTLLRWELPAAVELTSAFDPKKTLACRDSAGSFPILIRHVLAAWKRLAASGMAHATDMIDDESAFIAGVAWRMRGRTVHSAIPNQSQGGLHPDLIPAWLRAISRRDGGKKRALCDLFGGQRPACSPYGGGANKTDGKASQYGCSIHWANLLG